jgi:hypothetical protein
MSDVAFVLGNGLSRKSINLQELKNKGTVYGCNALYREFVPDYLIAVDSKMVLEIAKSNYQNYNTVWTNPNKIYKNIPNLNFFQPSKGWSSGPTALWLASQNGHKEIYILGFDYTGVGNNNTLFNNIYASTFNYKDANENATYHGNWLRQTVQTITEHPTIRYRRVIQSDNFCPSELNRIRNVDNILVEDFLKIFAFSY